jgi:hypothetical protein
LADPLIWRIVAFLTLNGNLINGGLGALVRWLVGGVNLVLMPILDVLLSFDERSEEPPGELLCIVAHNLDCVTVGYWILNFWRSRVLDMFNERGVVTPSDNCFLGHIAVPMWLNGLIRLVLPGLRTCFLLTIFIS